jgi:uncharacterized membrane protein (DUF485 family)
MTEGSLTHLASRRMRFALVLTALTMVIYFGFIALVAWKKAWMGTLIAPGLSIGILLGALTIASAWILTAVYVRWANLHYDQALDRAHEDGR